MILLTDVSEMPVWRAIFR